MSGWTLYWILILDNICLMAQILFTASIVLTFLLLLAAAIVGTSPYKTELDSAITLSFLRWAKMLGVVAAVTMFVGSFVPSTKQMAAIVVIPAVVNSEVIQSEAKELYDLAKQWMKDQSSQ